MRMADMITWIEASGFADQVRARVGGSQEWTFEESLQYDGLVFGVEQTAEYWDTIRREACEVCEICHAVFHRNDMEPCGPCVDVCPDCCEAWEGDA